MSRRSTNNGFARAFTGTPCTSGYGLSSPAWQLIDSPAVELVGGELAALSSPTGPMQTWTFEFEPDVASAARARRLARDVLPAHAEPVADTVVLLVSELVTNAVVHARSAAALQIAVDARRVRVTVLDASPVEPQLRAATRRAAGGRGMVLVDAMADAWGCELVSGGKSVWCELTLAVKLVQPRQG